MLNCGIMWDKFIALSLEWSDHSYQNYTADTLNLLIVEEDTDNSTRYHTTDNTTVEVPEDTTLNWKEFEYYRDLYITNVNTTYYESHPNSTVGHYIVTEAARGPKNYLRIGSYLYLWYLSFADSNQAKGIWTFLLCLRSRCCGVVFEDTIKRKWPRGWIEMFLLTFL